MVQSTTVKFFGMENPLRHYAPLWLIILFSLSVVCICILGGLQDGLGKRRFAETDIHGDLEVKNKMETRQLAYANADFRLAGRALKNEFFSDQEYPFSRTISYSETALEGLGVPIQLEVNTAYTYNSNGNTGNQFGANFILPNCEKGDLIAVQRTEDMANGLSRANMFTTINDTVTFDGTRPFRIMQGRADRTTFATVTFKRIPGITPSGNLNRRFRIFNGWGANRRTDNNGTVFPEPDTDKNINGLFAGKTSLMFYCFTENVWSVTLQTAVRQDGGAGYYDFRTA